MTRAWIGRNQTHNLSDQERFWEKVDRGNDSECWLWQGACNTSGYGNFLYNGKVRVSNRVAWMLTFGEIPKDMRVLHTCDIRNCCNPNHLFLGTYSDNTQDMLAKGRGPDVQGENHPGAKLTALEVEDIRFFWNTGKYTQEEIAEEFPVGRSQIANILCEGEWNYV